MAAGPAPNRDGQLREVLLNVFMEGTSNPLDPIVTQIALFARLCGGTPLPSELPPAERPSATEPGQYKVAFDGCGVSHGARGLIFAHGLREQCQVVRRHVEGFLKAGHRVGINFVGLSRGGIGGVYLAQLMQDFSLEQVVLNLLLYDPVPGNFIWMSRFLDWGEASNANLAMDISSVGNLGRVHVLYPHEPLPDIAVHAPLRVEFPRDCRVLEDVILGCHQGALWTRPRPETCLSFALIRDFLLDCGARLEKGYAGGLEISQQELLDIMVRELRRNEPTTRTMHAKISGTEVVRYPRGRFLNRAHQELLRRLGHPACEEAGDGMPTYMLDFKLPQ